MTLALKEHICDKQAVARQPGLWLIIGLGAALRLFTLNVQSLWLDEGTSYWIANRSWTALVAALVNDPHPPLYYLLLQPMIALGGSEWLLRLPSALAGIVSIGLIYVLSAELFDRQTGLLTAFLLAISPFHIWYAQEARMYALVAVFALAAGLCAVRALRTNYLIDWLCLALCEGLALWTDTAAIWFVLALNTAALLMAIRLWRLRRFWYWVNAQVIAVALYVPWLHTFLLQIRNAPASWIPPATVIVLIRTLTDFLSSYERTSLEAWLALLLLFASLTVSAQKLLRELVIQHVQYLLLSCWLIIPIGLSFLISQPYIHLPLMSLLFEPGRSLFLTRNLIVASFPLYLLVARSLLLAKRGVGASSLVVLVALNGVAYLGNNLSAKKEDFRMAAQVITEHIEDNDLIVFAPPYLKIPFAYYYYHNHAKHGEMPLEDLKDGFITKIGKRRYGSPVEALVHYHRIWLITNSDNIYRKDNFGTVTALEKQGRLVDHWQVTGVTVKLYALN